MKRHRYAAPLLASVLTAGVVVAAQVAPGAPPLSSPQGQTAGNEAVPYSDAQAPPAAPQRSGIKDVATAAREVKDCLLTEVAFRRAEDLSPKSTPGNKIYRLRFANVGSEECALGREVPQVAATGPDGATLKTPVVTTFAAARSFVIDRQQESVINVTWGKNCQDVEARTFMLAFGSTRERGRARTQPLTSPDCNGGGSEAFITFSGWQPAPERRREEPLRDRFESAPLRVTLNLPEQADEGALLQYEVVLENTGPTAFSMRPCPTYSQGIGDGDYFSNREDYFINCEQSPPTLEPGVPVRFAMELPLPSGLKGEHAVGWVLGKYPSPNTPKVSAKVLIK